jgi:hypothetical protein
MIGHVTERGAVAASVDPGSRSQLHSSAIGCVCGLLLATGPTFAQAFPAKPIRLVIPFAVGGSSDANARIIMPALTERWKQQIVLDPRPGAGTVIGTDLVAKSAPDGHTLLLTSNLFTNAPITYAKLPYDPHTDLVPITLVTISPHAIVAHPSLPVRDTRELIALAKARPRQMNMGNTGSPLATYNFNMLAKVSVEPIPYRRPVRLRVRLLVRPDGAERGRARTGAAYPQRRGSRPATAGYPAAHAGDRWRARRQYPGGVRGPGRQGDRDVAPGRGGRQDQAGVAFVPPRTPRALGARRSGRRWPPIQHTVGASNG